MGKNLRGFWKDSNAGITPNTVRRAKRKKRVPKAPTKLQWARKSQGDREFDQYIQHLKDL